MLLFLFGMDWATLVVFLLVVVALGLLIFWVSKKLLRKVMKNSSDGKIKALSRASALIFAPLIVIGSFGLFIYISIQTENSSESLDESVQIHYQIIDENLREDLTAGMTKTEVVALLGETDTTQSILTYDLSFPEAKEKYMLEITFDTTGLTSFKKIP